MTRGNLSYAESFFHYVRLAILHIYMMRIQIHLHHEKVQLHKAKFFQTSRYLLSQSKPKVHKVSRFRIPILRNFRPFDTLRIYFLQIHFNIIPQSTARSSGWSVSLRIRQKIIDLIYKVFVPLKIISNKCVILNNNYRHRHYVLTFTTRLLFLRL